MAGAVPEPGGRRRPGFGAGRSIPWAGRAEGNISGASRLLGVSRPTLYDLLKSYDLHG